MGASASTDFSQIGDLISRTQLDRQAVATIFQMYTLAAQRLDVPANDSASAVAAFLAGSYAGYTGKPFPDAAYRPLYQQFARSMSNDPDQRKLTRAQKVEMYQRLVLTGMIFQLAQLDLQAKPNARQQCALREAAGAAFARTAGISPDKVRFTQNGLEPR